MKHDALHFLEVPDVVHGYRTGEFGPTDVLASCLGRIEKFDDVLNAMVHVDSVRAYELAAASRRRYDENRSLGPIDGVPVIVKENVAVAGWPVGNGSAAVDSVIAPENAPLVDRLLEAGAVLVGTTRMPDHGWKGVTNGPLGAVPTPWDLSANAGGSSGGTGAGVAAGYATLGIGSDGAGSIRFPAAYCGIVGLKPTYGRIAAFARSAAGTLSHYGPMARSVDDVRTLLKVVAQPDPRDFTCSPAPVDDSLTLAHGLEDLRVFKWVETSLVHDNLVLEATDHVAGVLERRGASVDSGTIDTSGAAEALTALFAAPLYAMVQSVGADRRDDLDPALVEWSKRGANVTAADVMLAQQYRSKLAEQLSYLQQNYDVILSPVASVATAGVDIPFHIDAEPDRSPYAFIHNLTGRPALAMPVQTTPGARPVGVQLSGRRFEDELLLNVSAEVEREIGNFLAHSDNGTLLAIGG